MQLVVPKETRSGERRVAATPANISKLTKFGFVLYNLSITSGKCLKPATIKMFEKKVNRTPIF